MRRRRGLACQFRRVSGGDGSIDRGERGPQRSSEDSCLAGVWDFTTSGPIDLKIVSIHFARSLREVTLHRPERRIGHNPQETLWVNPEVVFHFNHAPHDMNHFNYMACVSQEKINSTSKYRAEWSVGSLEGAKKPELGLVVEV